MNDENNTVTIKEYSSGILDGLKDLNEHKDLPYLKKECFKYTKAGPYRIEELRNNKIKIENTSYSGIIQLDKIRIHFSTKVKTNLFYMLSFLKNEEYFWYDSEIVIEIKEGANFFDILGRLFLNELGAIFEKGFYKKYVRKEENIRFLKGKLLIDSQLKNDIRKRLKFSCSYEELTYDNLENQIILRATTLLIPLIRFNDNIKRDLIRYSELLKEEVSLVNVVPEDCNRVQFCRLNDYYEAIIRFSKVILQSYFIRSTYKGAAKGFNFIVNMNKVYEDFITTMVEEIVEEENEFENYIVEKQKRFDSLVLEKEIITRPDVILRRKDTLDDYPLIIDAKYKRAKQNADYFQVIAYSLAIPTIRSSCLIYPETEEIETKLTLVKDPTNPNSPIVKLYALKVNLDRDLDFSDYIKVIKKDLKSKLSACLAL